MAGAESALSTDFALQPGVYGSGDRLLAVNRSAEEDRAATLADEKVAELFKGLDFARVDDKAGNFASLIAGDLAAVPDRDDGRPDRRGRALPAEAKAGAGRRGGHVMSVSRSLAFLWTPWSLAASVLVVLVTAVLCFVAWRRSGYNRWNGLLELLRLALVACGGGAAQPARVGRGVPARGAAVGRRALRRLAEHGDERRRPAREAGRRDRVAARRSRRSSSPLPGAGSARR